MHKRAKPSLDRRDFLKAGGIAAGTLAVGGLPVAAAGRAKATSCIQINLVGGPSHLDTWDPKPDAPEGIRGPFRSMATRVPGIRVSELFPRLAYVMNKLALIRTVHHGAAPIHETGHQLLQTGRLGHGTTEYPHVGAVLSYFFGSKKSGVPTAVTLPGMIRNTGVCISHGQHAAHLGTAHDPKILFNDFDFLTESDPRTHLESLVGHALRSVELGCRLVTVNTADTVFNTLTWDCHADGGALNVNFDDYKNHLCPAFDYAFTKLVNDLESRGILESTLVVAMGEFGRTPKINPRGGRDHWPSCWTILMAGGGVRGGQVIGASDPHGREPIDRPVHCSEVTATILHALGIDPQTRIPGPEGRSIAIVDAKPVAELFS